MALDDDWVADVRRWYFDERTHVDGTPAQGVASDPAEADIIGYEAAWQPADGASPVHAVGAPRRDPG